MAGYKEPSFQERAAAATRARKKALEQLRLKSAASPDRAATKAEPAETAEPGRPPQ